MDLSVVTVTWNSKDYIATQIQSVFDACDKIFFEEIIIDNGSTDKTVEFVQQTFPTVQVIINKKNKGFSFANNQGLKVSKGEYILFLNPDMQLGSTHLDICIEWMQNHIDVGVMSVKLVDQKGNIHQNTSPRRFPKLWEQLALIVKLPHFFPHLLDSYYMYGMNPDMEQDVDSIRGSFMLMRRTFLNKTGWAFDPRYFCWYEDVDICREAKQHGYRVVYNPLMTVIDFVGQSFKKRTTLWKQKQFTKSMLIYFQKWEPWWKWIWIALLRPVGIIFAWVGDIFIG